MPEFTPEQLARQAEFYNAYLADKSILNKYQGEDRKRFIKMLRGYKSYLDTQPQQVQQLDTTSNIPLTTAQAESTGQQQTPQTDFEVMQETIAKTEPPKPIDVVRQIGQDAVADLDRQKIVQDEGSQLEETRFDPQIVERIRSQSGMSEEETTNYLAGSGDFHVTTGNDYLDSAVSAARGATASIIGFDAALLKDIGWDSASNYLRALSINALRESKEYGPLERGEFKGQDIFSIMEDKPELLGEYLIHSTIKQVPQVALAGISSFAGMASLGLTIIGGMAAGNRYMENIQKGVPHTRAFMDALLVGGGEIITEKFGTFETMKRMMTNKQVVRGIGNKLWETTKAFHRAAPSGAIREFGEEAEASGLGTLAGQVTGTDKREFLKAFEEDFPEMLESGLVALPTGGLLSGGGAAFQQAKAKTTEPSKKQVFKGALELIKQEEIETAQKEKLAKAESKKAKELVTEVTEEVEEITEIVKKKEPIVQEKETDVKPLLKERPKKTEEEVDLEIKERQKAGIKKVEESFVPKDIKTGKQAVHYGVKNADQPSKVGGAYSELFELQEKKEKTEEDKKRIKLLDVMTSAMTAQQLKQEKNYEDITQDIENEDILDAIKRTEEGVKRGTIKRSVETPSKPSTARTSEGDKTGEAKPVEAKEKTDLEKDIEIRDAHETIGAHIVRIAEPKKTMEQRVRDVYRKVFDDYDPIAQAVKDVEKTTGKKLRVSKNPYINARLARGWTGKSVHMLEKGMLDIELNVTGKSYNEIMQPHKKNENEIRNYMVAKRAIEMSERFDDDIDKLLGGGITKEMAETVIKDGDSKGYNKVAADLYAYQDQLLQNLRDTSVISKETYNSIKELNKYYIPWVRAVGMEDLTGAGKKVGSTATGIKAIKGSELSLLDPFETIVKNTFALTNIAERNKIAVQIASLAGQPGSTKWIKKGKTVSPVALKDLLDKTAEEGERGIERISEILQDMYSEQQFNQKTKTMFVWEDGKKVYYRLNQDLFDALQGINTDEVNTLVKFLSYPAVFLRAGATLSPEFALRNPVRDINTAYIYSKFGVTPIDFVRGLFHVIAKSGTYWKFRASGADMASLVSMDRSYMRRVKKEATMPRKERVLRTIINPLALAQKLSNTMELGTRVGSFAKGLKKGEKTGQERLDTMIDSAFEARDVTLDFNRKGQKTKDMRLLVAFMNAQLQGVDKMYRSFKENPTRTTLRAITSITIPSMALWLYNNSDPDRKEKYQNLPAWQRNMYWVIPMDDVELFGKKFSDINLFGDDFLRIPKPFDLGLMFGSLPERILDWQLNNDPKAVEKWGQQFFNNIVPDITPTALRPLIENFANYNTFYNKKLVPQYLEENVEEYLKYKASTSEAAKILGKLINYSPAKIDNLVKGWFAGLGQYGLMLADAGVRKVKGAKLPPEPTPGIRSWPGIKGFVAQFPAGNLKPFERFEEVYEESKKAHYSFEHLLKTQPEEAEAYLNDNEALISLWLGAKEFKDFQTQMYQTISLIRQDKKMSGDEKRMKIDDLYKTMFRAFNEADIEGSIRDLSQQLEENKEK